MENGMKEIRELISSLPDHPGPNPMEDSDRFREFTEEELATAGKAKCSCVYHAEQGKPCVHDLALLQQPTVGEGAFEETLTDQECERLDEIGNDRPL